MKSFDILSKETSLQNRLFLEASAGTGKTFTIEHLVVRLLIETNWTLDQILVVTFTRAATRELKVRIRTNLEKIVAGDRTFDYLSDLAPEQLSKIQETLVNFDQAQIFTIHGFCHRILQEFAFEALVGIDLQEWDESQERWAATEFLRTSQALTPQQWRRLLGFFRNDTDLLLKALVTSQPSFSPSAEELLAQANEQLFTFPLKEAFAELRPHYKGMTSPDFDRQAELLDHALQRKEILPHEWDQLIGEDKLWLEAVLPENLKLRSQYPGHVEMSRLRAHLFPLLEAARSPRKILKLLAFHWHQERKRLSRLYEKVTPDDLLKMVQERLSESAFIEGIENKFRAVIVDEFQDTDPIQWEIFNTLFSSKQALYLVGDPKQSIYAFRQADIYTFLSAAEQFTPEQKAALVTNYRSTRGLIEDLNRLFCRAPWLHLPRLGQTLPVPPVLAAKEGEGVLCFLLAQGEKGGSKQWPTPQMEETYFFPFIVHEIHHKNLDPDHTAILVKDRYQAARVHRYLKLWNLPSALYRGISLGNSLAVSLLEEFSQACAGSLSFLKKVLLGPLIQMPISELTDDKILEEKGQFVELAKLWEKEGLIAAIAKFLKRCQIGEWTSDLMQIVSKVAYIPDPVQMHLALERFRLEETSEQICASQGGIQILTTHASKGLEFETVFALGVACRTRSDDEPQEQLEELDAEKLRQWYVALTRAKRRLYIPFPQEMSGKPCEPGEASPLEIFWKLASPDLSTFTSLDLSTFSFHLTPYHQPSPPPPSFPSSRFFKPILLQSFSSLAQTQRVTKAPLDDGLPPGAETGTVLHRILEKLPHFESAIEETLPGTHLAGYESQIKTLIDRVLDLPLQGFCLRDIAWDRAIAEMEFLLPTPSTFLKGFIDLCFEYQGVYYLLDWKTNLLEDYTPASLEKAMTEHDYLLQGKIYATALTRYLKLYNSPPFGGVFFLFVRGPAAYHFQPQVFDAPRLA